MITMLYKNNYGDKIQSVVPIRKMPGSDYEQVKGVGF